MGKRFRPNWGTVHKFFGERGLPGAIEHWCENYGKSIAAESKIYTCGVPMDGTAPVWLKCPSAADEKFSVGSAIQLFVYPTENEMVSAFSHFRSSRDAFRGVAQKALYSVMVPWVFLEKGFPNYFLYHISFMFEDRTDASFDVFRRGYFGITKNHPLIRFGQHYSDMRLGRGHLLHNAWRAIHDSKAHFNIANVSVVGAASTLDEIYNLEEDHVQKFTLSPRGLNAIPGGKAGLRFMHLLRQNSPLPDIEDREQALIDLENGKSPVATHYRKGHIRHLPDGFAKRTTWVNPCWVNLPKEIAA